MSYPAGSARTFGEGPLSRAAALLYTLLVVEILLLATTAPGLIPLVLLDRDTSNLPLAAGCALPLGPALSAALYALRHRSRDLTELRPAAAFWRGYRRNVRGVLQIWIPFLVLATILAVNLTHLAAAAVPTWWAALLALIAVAVLLWAANALVIASLFAFRATDVAWLAAYLLVRTRGATLGNACLLIVAAGITAVSSEAVLALLASVFASVLLHSSRPTIEAVRAEFTA
jgi:uncharacterized membrane protein YesL